MPETESRTGHRESRAGHTDRSRTRYPERIVCLTEETTETLYLLGEDARIVGISGFTVRPARARKEKPRVSAFTSARIDRILREVKSSIILQPGPAALTDGVRKLQELIEEWSARQGP